MNKLQQHIDTVRSLKSLTELKANVLFYISVVLLTLALFLTIEAVFCFEVSIRTLLVVVWLIIITVGMILFIVRPLLIYYKLLPAVSDEQIANLIGKHFSHIGDRFLNMYQLARNSGEYAKTTSAELIAASINSFEKQVHDLPFHKVVDTSKLGKAKQLCLLSIAIFSIVVIIFPSTYYDAAYRLVYFKKKFDSPLPFYFVVFPGDKDIVRGDSITIEAVLQPTSTSIWELPDNIIFRAIPENQQRYEERILEQYGRWKYRLFLPNIRSTIKYSVYWKNIKSDEYTLTVHDRPLIRSLRVKLDYPAYTRLPSQRLDEFVADVTALRGTIVNIEAQTSKQISDAKILFDDSTSLALNVQSTFLRGRFKILRNTKYAIMLRDVNGLENIDPVWYTIRVTDDEHPTVAILEPGRNIDITDNVVLPLKIMIKDDYGFSKLRIAYRLVHSRFELPKEYYTVLPVSIPDEGIEHEVIYLWQLKSLNLVPEDIVEYYAEVFDNDIVRGPKSAISERYTLRLPSIEEVFADIEKSHNETYQVMDKAYEKANQLRKEIESFERELKKQREVDWQTQQKTEELEKRYKELREQLDEARRTIDEAVKTMEQQNILSPNTLEKYIELQQLFQQLMSDELQELFRQLQQSAQQMDKQQLQQLMQQLVLNEEQLRQSIERTIELLKRLHIEQKLDELKKRVETIIKEQESIEQALNNKPQPEEQRSLAERQKKLANKQRELQEEMYMLQKKMEEFFTEMPADKMNELSKKMHEQRIDEQLESIANNIQQQQFNQAAQQQRQVRSKLNEILQQLSALQEKMLQNQAAYIISELRRATYNLLEISKQQEQLHWQSKQALYGSPQLRENARTQEMLQQSLSNIIQLLSELAGKSFIITPDIGRSLGETMARMKSAVKSLEERNGQVASQQQLRAMELLNKSALQLHQAMQSMMQQSGGGGGFSLFQQLQNMAGQQMALNIETQQRGGLTGEEGKKLAHQQEKLRKTLEQLRKEAEASIEFRRLAQQLMQIEEQMKEVVSDLEQKNVNPETIQKQEKILSRLLDASRSMRERDYEQRRRAETATTVPPHIQQQIQLDQMNKRNRYIDELLKAKELRYAREYQELIKKYFDTLEKEEKAVH